MSLSKKLIIGCAAVGLAVLTAALVPPVYQVASGNLPVGAIFHDGKKTPACPFSFSQAIVVFSGDKGRIETALKLQAKGKFSNPDLRLFISGDSQTTKLASLKPFAQSVRTILDLKARNTIDNGLITAQWVKKNRVRSVCLVTDDYHMARSYFELKTVAPELEIKPVPLKQGHVGKAEPYKLACRVYEDFAVTFLGLDSKPGQYCYSLRDKTLPNGGRKNFF